MLHKFFNHHDIPWVNLVWEAYYSNRQLTDKLSLCSFWWRDCLKPLLLYKENVDCSLEKGNSIQLWHDTWHGLPPMLIWPQLHSFAKDSTISISKLWNMEEPSNHFHLTLSEEAFLWYYELQSLIIDIQISTNNDTWHCLSGAPNF